MAQKGQPAAEVELLPAEDMGLKYAAEDTGDRGLQVGYATTAQLAALLTKPDTPAAAKVMAARTLAEIQGLIGKHQIAPDRGDTSALSSLSRDELVAELERLRTAVGLGRTP
jgi:hypothetical protein